MPRRLLSQISSKLGRSSLDGRPDAAGDEAPETSQHSKSGTKLSGVSKPAAASVDAKIAEAESMLVEAERRISFVQEREQQADQRVAAAEARARQAEEQLMSIAATLRVPRDKLAEAVKPDSRAMQRARSVGPRGRAAARHGALPEGTHMMSGEAAADQQSDSSWSFPVRDDSWDFKSDGVDGWDTRSGSSVSRSQDLDKFPSGRLPSVGEAAHRVDTSAADKRIFTKGYERRARSFDARLRSSPADEVTAAAASGSGHSAVAEPSQPSTSQTLATPFAAQRSQTIDNQG